MLLHSDLIENKFEIIFFYKYLHSCSHMIFTIAFPHTILGENQ